MKKAKFGDVDMDFVLGIGGYDLERLVLLFFFVDRHKLKIICHILLPS